MKGINPKIVGLIVIALISVALIRCGLFFSPFEVCARGFFVDIGLWSIHWLTVGFAIWAGYEFQQKFKKTWVSWVIGIAVLIAMNAGLSWMGFTLPEHDSEADTDYNYRR